MDMVGCHRADMDAVDDMDGTWTGHLPMDGTGRGGGSQGGPTPRLIAITALFGMCFFTYPMHFVERSLVLGLPAVLLLEGLTGPF